MNLKHRHVKDFSEEHTHDKWPGQELKPRRPITPHSFSIRSYPSITTRSLKRAENVLY